MALTSEGMSVADMAAVLGNNDGFGNGNGAWWLLILLIFANNGWGNNGFGGGRYDAPYATVNDVQSGFNQSALISGITGISTALSNGFANAEISRANTLANLTNQMNTIAMNQQNCCCENRAAVADLKYTVATENCADRAAISDALRDVIDANNASTQRILDQMCQDKIDAKNEQIAALQTQLNLASLAASQNLQTQQILAGQESAVNAVERYLSPTPVPAYIVANPNCCSQNYGYGCGCGN